MCVGVSVWLGWNGIRVAGWSLQHFELHCCGFPVSSADRLQERSEHRHVSGYVMGLQVSVLQASACNTDTTPTQPHRNSNIHRTKNNTTNVVIQQKSCKLLMMDILMSETCWARKKWNKIASDIKLVFYSSNSHNDARSNKHKVHKSSWKVSTLHLSHFHAIWTVLTDVSNILTYKI